MAITNNINTTNYNLYSTTINMYNVLLIPTKIIPIANT